MMTQPAFPARLPEPPRAEPIEPVRLRLHTPVRSAPADDGETQAGPNVLGYLQYRWVTVAFLGGALGLGLAYTAWNVIPSKYTTQSMIRVTADPLPLYASENPMGRGDFNTYLKTQADMLRSQFVLAAAIRDPAVAELPMIREQVDPIQYLSDELKVETKDGSEMIKVSLSGDDPRAIAAIVNSIQSAFFREVVEDELLRKKARLKLLEDNILSMQKELQQKYANLAKVEVPQKPANDLNQAVGAQLAAGQVVHLKEVLFTLDADLRAAQARQESIARRLKDPTPETPAEPPHDGGDNDPKLAPLNKQIEQCQKRIDYYVSVLGAPPKDRAVVEINKKMAELKSKRDDILHTRAAEHEKAQTHALVKRLTEEGEGIKSLITNLTSRREQTLKLIDEYQAVAANPSGPDERPLDFLRVDIKEREGITKGMIDKANLLRLEVNAPARVRPFQTAAVPLKKDMKKQVMATALGAMFGVALVGFCVVSYESRVRRALSLADVQRATLGPVVGVVPAGGGSGPAPGAVAEALDKTRCQILQQLDRPGSKVILVGSALRDEGKASLAWRLAESFARTSSRTVLVDFDLRAPALHTLVQVPNEVGCCEALAGSAELAAAVQTLPHGLHLLPAGRWADSVRPHLVAERIGPLLSRLRERFDFVVVNTHPLLAVAETSLAVRFADAVLLAVEKHESRLPLVSRAQDKIAGLAPDSFGLVFLGASEDECLN